MSNKKSWFSSHLNWTYIIATYGGLLLYIPLLVLGKLEETPTYVIGVSYYTVVLLAGVWLLKQKNRSFWFLLLSGLWLVFLENKSLDIELEER